MKNHLPIFYVYEHWRPDRDECFYVGEGHGARANTLGKSRNRHHRAIQAKLSRMGMCVEVRLVREGLVKDDARLLEIERIAFWRANGIAIVNMNAGGLGGTSPTAEVRAKMSRVHKGKTISAAHRAAITAKNTGKPRSREAIEKTTLANKGKKRTAEQIAKMKGPSPETAAKISAAKKGKPASAKVLAAIKASWTEQRRADQARVTAARAEYMNAVRTAKGRGPMSETTRAAIRKANVGRKMPAHILAAMSQPRSEEFKKKLRASWTPERRAAQAARCALVADKRKEKRMYCEVENK